MFAYTTPPLMLWFACVVALVGVIFSLFSFEISNHWKAVRKWLRDSCKEWEPPAGTDGGKLYARTLAALQRESDVGRKIEDAYSQAVRACGIEADNHGVTCAYWTFNFSTRSGYNVSPANQDKVINGLIEKLQNNGFVAHTRSGYSNQIYIRWGGRIVGEPCVI